MASILLSSYTLNFLAGIFVYPSILHLATFRRGNSIDRFIKTYIPNVRLEQLLLSHPIFDLLVNTRPVLKLINLIYKRKQYTYTRIFLNNVSFFIGVVVGFFLIFRPDSGRPNAPWHDSLLKFLMFPVALFDDDVIVIPPLSEYERTTWMGLPQEYKLLYDQSRDGTFMEYCERLEEEHPGILGPHGPCVTNNPFYN